jgi:hypothetical protein
MRVEVQLRGDRFVCAIGVVPVRQRRAKRKSTSRRPVYKVGLSSHTLFSSQAISSSRSATTS